MRLIFVTQDLKVQGAWSAGVKVGNASDGGAFQIQLQAPSAAELASGQIRLDHVYCCTVDELRSLYHCLRKPELKETLHVFNPEAAQAILGRPDFPRYLGADRSGQTEFVPLETRIEQFPKRDKIKLAILNGMGRELGDSMVGLQALRLFYRELHRHFQRVELHLFRSFLSTKVSPLYAKETMLASQTFLPIPVARLQEFDAYLDMSEMFGPFSTNQQPMMDLFLDELSLDKKQIPEAEKRVRMKLDDRVVQELSLPLRALKARGQKLLLFHPFASSKVRSIHAEKIPALLEALLQRSDYTIVSAVKLDFRHERFVDLSGLSPTFDHFAYLVSQMDAILTVDTVTYHLADSFNIPTVVLFSTIQPDYRLRYYPFCAGILLGGDQNKVLGKHGDLMASAEDLAYVRTLWDQVDVDQVLQELRRVTEKSLTVAETRLKESLLER